jgi:4-diphosphocytidyl-2-C-methyl-D-erythritol kinase
MKILSPAKINLFLHVTGKRPDGYHTLVTLMCCIELYDILLLEINDQETVITCSNSNVPKNENNLAYRAAKLFFEHFPQYHANQHVGVKINIDKHIPVSAGLGGGSSNAAAVFAGLNQYYGYPFSTTELLAMGLSIGADVPFFIYNQPALASGIGENLEPYHGLKTYHVLLVYPDLQVSTAEVYKNLDLGLTKCEKKLKRFLLKLQPFNVTDHLCNDLESVTASRCPDIFLAKKALLDHGAAGALMSGSGPTVFGLFSGSLQAQKAYQALLQNRKWQVFLADMITGAGIRVQAP